MKNQKPKAPKLDSKFSFLFSNEEDCQAFKDWWNDHGYYQCIEHFENSGMNIMFRSQEDSEIVSIFGADYED